MKSSDDHGTGIEGKAPGSSPATEEVAFSVRHRARAPTSVLDEGAKFWEQPIAAFPRLLDESYAVETPIGRRLLQGLAIFEEKRGFKQGAARPLLPEDFRQISG